MVTQTHNQCVYQVLLPSSFRCTPIVVYLHSCKCPKHRHTVMLVTAWRAQGRRMNACTHPDRRDAHADDNALLGEGGEVGGQAEVTAVVGQQHTVAHGAQGLNALNEGLLLDTSISICPVQQVSTLRPYQAFLCAGPTEHESLKHTGSSYSCRLPEAHPHPAAVLHNRSSPWPTVDRLLVRREPCTLPPQHKQLCQVQQTGSEKKSRNGYAAHQRTSAA